MSTTALVADIQRSSIHDGPGLRTTVFLKGCPLHCVWCHNPECISFEPQELFYPEKCIGCGKCSEGCYAGARVVCGRRMTSAGLLEQVLQDKLYYGAEGGVTVSGGEPLAQPEFLLEFLTDCERAGLNTAVETSLLCWNEAVFHKLKFVMADIKLWSSEEHRRHTGVPNEAILENFRRLDALGIPFWVRTPVVPGVTDAEENIRQIAAFVRTLRHAEKYELLPYHPLGVSKQQALGMELRQFPVPEREKMEHLRALAAL